MPLYHLHIRSPSKFIEDEEGAEFNDVGSAMIEAVRSARCLMKGDVGDGKLDLNQSIEVCDAEGQQVGTVPFAEAIKVVQCSEPASVVGSAGGRTQ
jgi:hypothetical protein